MSAERQIYTPPGGPPQGPSLAPRIFKNLGEEKIRSLVHLFFEQIPQSDIIGMYPEPDNLALSEEKLADFMIQVSGGPAYYIQKFGPPRMRARHFPFEIDEKARRTWLGCFRKALNATEMEKDDRELIWEFVVVFSAWMVNKAPLTEEGS